MNTETTLVFRKKIFAIISLTFFLATGIFAQSVNRELNGKVSDQNGSLIANANVVLRNKQTGLERVVQTDGAGEFRFADFADGEYEVIVNANGFRRSIVQYNNQTNISVTLEISPLESETTIYTGSRQEELRESLNTKVDVITQNQIRDTGYENVGEVLRELPGIVTRRGSETGTSSGAAGEQIQGIGSRQALVMLDGFPVINARGIKSGNINLDRQSTSRLEQIEVVKGSASALYGSDAIGGVVNLITREPKRPLEGAFTVSGGNFGRFSPRGEIGFKREKLGGFFSFERHKSNGFDLTPTTVDTTGAGFHHYDFFGKLKYEFTPDFYVTGLADVRKGNSFGYSLGEEGNQSDDIDDITQSYGLTANWTINPRTVVQARGYFTRYDEIGKTFVLPNSRYPNGKTPAEENLFQRYGRVDASLLYVWGERQIVQFGGEWTTDRYRGINRLRDTQGERADTKVVWAQDKINVTNRVTLTLGLRFDDHSIFGSAYSPKIGLNIRVTDRINARASWGRGFRAPDLGQLYYRLYNPTNLYQVFGNPKLSPEHSGSWQFGAEYSSTRKNYRFGVNFFRNDVRNLIEATNFGFVRTQGQAAGIFQTLGLNPTDYNTQLNRLLFVYTNLQNIYTQGVEADADIKLPKNFALSGAYTYLDARNKQTGEYLDERSKHQGFVKLAYANNDLGFRTNLRGTFFSNWRTSTLSNRGLRIPAVAPAFQVWDFYAAKTINKNFEVFGAVDNMFNSKDLNVGKFDTTGQPLPIYRNEAGRMYRVGMTVRFSREK